MHGWQVGCRVSMACMVGRQTWHDEEGRQGAFRAGTVSRAGMASREGGSEGMPRHGGQCGQGGHDGQVAFRLGVGRDGRTKGRVGNMGRVPVGRHDACM